MTSNSEGNQRSKSRIIANGADLIHFITFRAKQWSDAVISNVPLMIQSLASSRCDGPGDEHLRISQHSICRGTLPGRHLRGYMEILVTVQRDHLWVLGEDEASSCMM